MNTGRLFFTCCIIGASVLMTACSSTQHLKEGEYLLVKNKVEANRKELPTKGDLHYLAKPTANQQFFGLFPLKAALYQSMQPEEGKKDRKWRQWVRKTFGEEPVLFDSASMAASNRQMRQYLFNKGYFKTAVDNEISYHRKKAKVRYLIHAEHPYTLNEINYQISDTLIRKLILQDAHRSLLQKGVPFDVDLLDEERERISDMMNRRGYFHFTEDDISYRIDSNLNSHRFNLMVVVKNGREILDSNGNKLFLPQRKYYIRNIGIHASDMESRQQHTDSLLYTETHKNEAPATYQFYFGEGVKYRPKALVRQLYFQPNSLYSSLNSKRSYNRFNDMQNFRFIRLSYQETAESKSNPSDSGWVDCLIQLSKMENHKVDLEVLGKDIGNEYGVGVNLNYKNRNIFHGGEVFYSNLLFSTEFQRTTNDNEANGGAPIWRYRNFEIGGEVGLHFPVALFPHFQDQKHRFTRASTDWSFGYFFQQRDHYSRLINNMRLKYEWKPRTNVSHALTLVDVNMVKIYKDSIFSRNLANYSQRIQEKYTDHVLVGTNYKLVYSSLKGSKRKNFYLLRLNLNAYGNTLYSLFKAAGASRNDQGQYTIFGTPFTGFVSGELDYTYNIMMGEKSSLVLHTDIGMGSPTFNASTLPFERSFYLGGSNSMRAWNLRSLGPGSYHGNLSNFESTGDLKLEFNLEVRHPIYKNFYAAYFADAGNIWNLKRNVELPNGEFAWDRFYKEIAIDGGIGLRWDISFLVLRMDVAVPVYTPYYSEEKRWIDDKVSLKDLRFCFGIGYPF